MQHPTIAAISTPPGHGGIGIVKISGPAAIPIALSVFKPRSASCQTAPPPFPEPRHAYYGYVFSGTFDQIIDEAIFVLMPGPNSHTGEDVIELQVHGGPLVLETLLKVVLRQGAQMAEPGEFTRRAFLNGRMDLTQAEAVIDMINARSAHAAAMAAAMMSGELKNEIHALRDALHALVVEAEAAIDFPEEMETSPEQQAPFSSIETELVPKISELISRCDALHFLREGLKVVIAGSPNVGKSSLMNRLINKDRSIVTDVPGTTRDFIEDALIHNGMSIIVTDTAGIRNNPDAIEGIGIEMAWKRIAQADLVLLVLDAGRPIHREDLAIFERLHEKKKIIVINKTDLPAHQVRLSLPEEWTAESSVRISALYNQGIDVLKEEINRSMIGESLPEHAAIPNLRQKQCLEKALQSLTDAQQGGRAFLPPELIAIDLRAALDRLMEITGEITKPDILDAIFSRFCIGK